MNVCQMMCDCPYDDCVALVNRCNCWEEKITFCCTDDREQCEDCDIYTAGQTFLKFIKKNLKRRCEKK